ncbi:hypothetical protein NCCP1664_09310 [Zafaria cholistanensis]|uniref:DUF2332 domain-containing protein n=1 Tax=Zafaria cholistanensis TaxID=1682741 RepID=A0A5A7NND2_9MICC|nr:DUF2332 domain-containing protein [Zafaria cholistanensis]GER22434.1 hypothetical protein NCCP1664_09310 [Zafaria cholistanensis]
MEKHPDHPDRVAAEEITEAWASYAEVWFQGHSELYTQWCSRTATDPDLLGRVATLPEDKRTPLLVFAAARYLGCGEVPFARFRAFALERWEEVAGVVLGHQVQTNEPARCATLLPALALVAERERRPLALIEVGPSAGLCLLPDLYSYQYDGGPRLGSGTPLLRCATSGNPPLPDRLPEVAWRAGIDLNPLDGTDPDTVRWLEALVWPGEAERLANLRAALETLRQARPRPVLERGDLNERIADLVGRAPEGSTPVVFHSAVLAYLSPADRARFSRTVRGLDCHWVSNESFFLDKAGDTSPASREGYFTLSLDGTPLAHTGPHGAELHWLPR